MIKAWYFLVGDVDGNSLAQVGPFASREQAMAAKEALKGNYCCSEPYEGVVK